FERLSLMQRETLCMRPYFFLEVRIPLEPWFKQLRGDAFVFARWKTSNLKAAVRVGHAGVHETHRHAAISLNRKQRDLVGRQQITARIVRVTGEFGLLVEDDDFEAADLLQTLRR